MKYTLIQNNQTEELFIFLLGWGMDHRPLLPLTKKLNVLFVYDYTDPTFCFNFSAFSKFRLIAYSAGVMMASVLADRLPACCESVAINGTVDLMNEKTGLTSDVINVFKSLSLDNYMVFRKDYLLETHQDLETFGINEPLRTIEDSLMELDTLEKIGKSPKIAYPFSQILIAENDRIIPAKKQMTAWKKQAYRLIKGGHFPFYQFDSIDDFFDVRA